MKVFVTGATGYVGSKVVEDLLANGHQVIGLARSEQASEKLKALGVEVHVGDLEDLNSLRLGVSKADGVIHTGFIHDFTRFAEVCAIDKKAVEAMGEALLGTECPFVVTSATAIVANNGLTTEDARAQNDSPNPRVGTELAVDRLAEKGINVSIVRLSPSVHGSEDSHGFIPTLIRISQAQGKSAYVGEGLNVWPAVNRMDAVKLFRLALENPSSPGTRYHAVAEEGVKFKDIAEAIGKKLHLPTISIGKDDAVTHFASFSHFAQLNNPVSSARTKQILGWSPQFASLLEDLSGDLYFPNT